MKRKEKKIKKAKVISFDHFASYSTKMKFLIGIVFVLKVLAVVTATKSEFIQHLPVHLRYIYNYEEYLCWIDFDDLKPMLLLLLLLVPPTLSVLWYGLNICCFYCDFCEMCSLIHYPFGGRLDRIMLNSVFVFSVSTSHSIVNGRMYGLHKVTIHEHQTKQNTNPFKRALAPPCRRASNDFRHASMLTSSFREENVWMRIFCETSQRATECSAERRVKIQYQIMMSTQSYDLRRINKCTRYCRRS